MLNYLLQLAHTLFWSHWLLIVPLREGRLLIRLWGSVGG